MDERGSFLMSAVWAVAVFSIMTASIALQAGGEMVFIKRELGDFQERADFLTGLNAAVSRIQEDAHPHEDSRDKSWFGEIRPERLKGRLIVRTEDEESKLNLNYASEAFLSEFLKRFEDEVSPLKGDRKAFLKAVRKLKYDKRLESLEELLLSDEVEKSDLEVLREWLTVYPERPFVNPNTAKPLVLESLVRSLSGDSGLKEILIRRLQEGCAGSCFFRTEDLNPESFARKLKLPQTPLMMQLIQEFIAFLTVDSETFCVLLKAQSGCSARAIFRYRAGQERPEILSWFEDNFE